MVGETKFIQGVSHVGAILTQGDKGANYHNNGLGVCWIPTVRCANHPMEDHQGSNAHGVPSDALKIFHRSMEDELLGMFRGDAVMHGVSRATHD